MMRLEIVPAQRRHIRSIARRMRRADRDEVMAASGVTPEQALRYSLDRSSVSWTALVDGRPEVMFGVADINILAGIGAVWLLGTDAVEIHFRVFLRQSIEWRRKLFERYSTLKNFVTDDNEVSKRWLKWMGATFGEPIEFDGHRFRMFEMRA